MGDRLPLQGLHDMDEAAARKALDLAIAKRNAAERQVHEARWALERLYEKRRQAMYTDEQLRAQAGRRAP